MLFDCGATHAHDAMVPLLCSISPRWSGAGSRGKDLSGRTEWAEKMAEKSEPRSKPRRCSLRIKILEINGIGE